MDAGNGDNACYQLRRGDVEGWIVCLHPVAGDGRPLKFEDLPGIPLLDGDFMSTQGATVGTTVAEDIKRNAQMPRTDGQLQGPHLVGHGAVHGDPVRRGKDLLNHSFGHAIGRHIVGDQGGVDSHFAQGPGRQSGPLEIGPRLRTYRFYILTVFFCILEHVK